MSDSIRQHRLREREKRKLEKGNERVYREEKEIEGKEYLPSVLRA